MRMIVYEGTLEEIKEVQKGIISDGAQLVSIAAKAGDSLESISGADEADAHSWASVPVAHRALTRIKLSKEQRTVIITTYKAHPEWVLATTLQDKTGYTASQFAGLMGAFGRRFTHTEGYLPGMWFFDQEWDYDNGCVRYRLPDSVREAVEKAKLV